MRIEFKKIKLFLRKFPDLLAENFLFTLLGLIFLALIFGILIFYRFYFLPEKKVVSLRRPFVFKEELCQKILQILDQREQRFEKTESKIYPDLFGGS